MMHCLSQFAGKSLLNKEASRLLIAVTNAKIIIFYGISRNPTGENLGFSS
jgi:hypothetical protein